MAKEQDFIGASARLASSSSLLNRRLCDEVFQREAASQDLIDAYLNHISRKSRLPLFPDVSFSCPLLHAGATPRFSALYPHPRPFLFRYAPLFLFLRTFSSCLISLRSLPPQPASFFDPWSFGARTPRAICEDSNEKARSPGGGPRSFARQPVQIPAHTAQSRFHEFPRRIWSPPIDAEIWRESCRLSASSSLRSSSARTLWRKLLAARRDERRIVFLGLDSSFATLPPDENSAGGPP